jgi:hypothetical protein
MGEIYPFWSPSALMLRRSALVERGQLFTTSALHADVALYYELLEQHDFGMVHDLLCFVRSHDDSVTSAESTPFNKLLASNLQLLITYGPRFLNADELARRRDQHLERYYRVLAQSALEARPAEFWQFHRRALAAAGSPLQSSRLAAAIVRELTNRPRPSARRVAKRLLGPAGMRFGRRIPR